MNFRNDTCFSVGVELALIWITELVVATKTSTISLETYCLEKIFNASVSDMSCSVVEDGFDSFDSFDGSG